MTVSIKIEVEAGKPCFARTMSSSSLSYLSATLLESVREAIMADGGEGSTGIASHFTPPLLGVEYFNSCEVQPSREVNAAYERTEIRSRGGAKYRACQTSYKFPQTATPIYQKAGSGVSVQPSDKTCTGEYYIEKLTECFWSCHQRELMLMVEWCGFFLCLP
jgi:hypothetical protein